MASQAFFGLVSVDYPLVWSSAGGYFKSAYPLGKGENLVVLHDIFNQVDYMSPEKLDISFGAKYDGMPKINLVSAAFKALDDKIGASKAMADAVGGPLTEALTGGVEDMDKLVADSLEGLLSDLLAEAQSDSFGPLYKALEADYQNNPSMNFDTWLNSPSRAQQILDKHLGSTSPLRTNLENLSAEATSAYSMVNRVKNSADKGVAAIDSILDILEETDVSQPGGGTVKQRQLVKNLVKELIKQLAGDAVASALNGVIGVATSDFNKKLNEILEDVDPTLDRLTVVLGEEKKSLQKVSDALQGSGKMLTDFQAIVNAARANGELDDIVVKVRSAAMAYISGVAGSSGIKNGDTLAAAKLFDEFGRDEFKSALSAKLRDQLLWSNLFKEFQYALRHWTYDLDIAMHNAVDGVFAIIQDLIQDAISELLGPLDKSINGVVGDAAKYLGAGSVKGIAQFNKYSLRRLRLDGEFQFKIPDDMEIHAYLEIQQYTSQSLKSGCLKPGEKLVEVSLGAMDMKVDWLSPKMRADIGVKFAMKKDTNGSVLPIGLGGRFKMTGGSIKFSEFKITSLAAGMGLAVGGDYNECYIAATAGMQFNAYKMAGGIFFGRTCTLDPILLIDEDVGNLLGTPPFTGAYMYGEVWLPISEIVLGIPASCMFNISAGVGAGAFFFLEGPTWGGQMMLGVSGEALCVVSISGNVKMIGVARGVSHLSFSGRGSLSGSLGYCPFCLKISKSAKVSYKEGDWSVDW
jgi:hypothetical protein